MSNGTLVSEEIESIGGLVAKLESEHREFPSQVKELNDDLDSPSGFVSLTRHFTCLQDRLTEHMVTEEFELYPVLMDRGLFDETVSTIMQQHHELTEQLNKMELALRVHDVHQFKLVLDEMEGTLHVHQPAEEEKVFPLALA